VSKQNIIFRNSFLGLVVLIIFGCKGDPPIPKPKGYFKFNFPEKESLQTFNFDACKFNFEYPNYMEIEQDTLYFNEKPDDPCWLNVKYPSLNGIVHMSYKPLNKNSFVALTEDYHRLKFKHATKADFIDDALIHAPEKDLYGMISQVGGNVASSYQFYLTDSTEHYVRGALYFRAAANADSLKPAVEFVKKDLVELFDTWEWN